MEKTPTAKEMEDAVTLYEAAQDDVITNLMIKFAQLHVEAALKAASEQAKAWVDSNGEWVDSRVGASVQKSTILTAYPKENIK